jgi:hypothetical protein
MLWVPCQLWELPVSVRAYLILALPALKIERGSDLKFRDNKSISAGIFDQWKKLYPALNVPPEIQISNGLYFM